MIPSSLIPREAAGETLTGEQKAYLDGFFAGLKNRGFTFADVEPSPVPAAAPAVEPEKRLIFEERIKKDLHPLDAYPLLLQHAAARQAPDKENTFRFKWHGLFYLAPSHQGFMARLRIPGGALKSFQLRALADIADQLTSGYIQITTRSNLQMRLIQPKDAPEFLRRIQSIGLHTRGAGADNVRNLTCDPTSGVDREEIIETLPLIEELGSCILNSREFYDLPRKFNIAFHGGGSIPTVEDTNDIGFRAVRLGEGEAGPGIPAGSYFRVALGGATGHKAFARDLGVLVRPEQSVAVACSLLRVFLKNGNRGDRKRARLKHLLETWTLERYLEETEADLGSKLLRSPAPEIKPSQPSSSHPHVGVYRQKQPGLHWVGAAVPVGQVTSRQLRRLAEIVDLYGSGDVRLTVWQNVVLPNIPEAFLSTVKKSLMKMGWGFEQSNLKSGFIACTGNSYCKFASANTKGHAIELMEWLDKRFKLDHPINIHVTGCPNSCAQHYMGDIGLLGTRVKVEGESHEGYHIFVGGGFGDRQAVGRQIFHGVSIGQLRQTMERILKGYLAHRNAGETFQSFTLRHEVGRLQEIFSGD